MHEMASAIFFTVVLFLALSRVYALPLNAPEGTQLLAELRLPRGASVEHDRSLGKTRRTSANTLVRNPRQTQMPCGRTTQACRENLCSDKGAAGINASQIHTLRHANQPDCTWSISKVDDKGQGRVKLACASRNASSHGSAAGGTYSGISAGNEFATFAFEPATCSLHSSKSDRCVNIYLKENALSEPQLPSYVAFRCLNKTWCPASGGSCCKDGKFAKRLHLQNRRPRKHFVMKGASCPEYLRGGRATCACVTIEVENDGGHGVSNVQWKDGKITLEEAMKANQHVWIVQELAVDTCGRPDD